MTDLIREAKKRVKDKKDEKLDGKTFLIRARRLGKRGPNINAPPPNKQNQYILTIELLTNQTGTHAITLRPSDFPQNLPALRAFTISRGNFTGRNPYDSPLIMGKNQEWDALNKKISDFLSITFKKDTLIRLPSPLYDGNRNKDRIFKVSSFNWIEEPNKSKWLGNFKFYIRYNPVNALQVKVFVRANGNFLKDTPLNKLPPSKLPPTTTIGKIKKGCDHHIDEIKNMFNGKINSNKFSKLMALPTRSRGVSRWSGGKNNRKNNRKTKKIRINPKMRGVFTRKAKKNKMNVQKYATFVIKKYKGKTRNKRQLKLLRQAVFAKTAKKWKKTRKR
jgi:hypothetical protein